MNPQVSFPKDALSDFCEQHGITRLAIFGSALGDDFGPDSDIDILVEFAPGCVPGLIRLAGMEMELERLLDREVDLLTRKEIEQSRNYIRRKSILETAEVIYAA